jgi:hypothetical protein
LPGWLKYPRVAAGLALAVAVTVVLGAIAQHGHGRHHREHGAPRRAGTVIMLDVGHRLLATGGRWDLFAAGPGILLRIDLVAGMITETRVPPLMSSGPVSLVAGPRQAIIRPLDFVPGYLVPDGRPARLLPAALGRGGRAFPVRGRGRCGCRPGSASAA